VIDWFTTSPILIPVKIAEESCDRLVYNPRTEKAEAFICLGESMIWDNTEYRLLAEAIHPADSSIAAFFDITGDCEVDAVGMYYLLDGMYYMGRIVSETEKALGMKIMKEVPCLKK
jgi:hypothetical protein